MVTTTFLLGYTRTVSTDPVLEIVANLRGVIDLLGGDRFWGSGVPLS